MREEEYKLHLTSKCVIDRPRTRDSHRRDKCQVLGEAVSGSQVPGYGTFGGWVGSGGKMSWLVLAGRVQYLRRPCPWHRSDPGARRCPNAPSINPIGCVPWRRSKSHQPWVLPFSLRCFLVGMRCVPAIQGTLCRHRVLLTDTCTVPNAPINTC